MAYIVGIDRYQSQMVTTSLDEMISEDNSVRVIDAYVGSLELSELGFIEYSGTNKGQAPYRRSDLLKLHILGNRNKKKFRTHVACEYDNTRSWNHCEVC